MALACGRHHHAPWWVRPTREPAFRSPPAVELRQDVPENRRARGGDVPALASPARLQRATAPRIAETAVCVAAYALSPIDLIPDFIPVLGYLDDAILLPLAILLVIKLIPPPIMAEHRAVAVVAEGRPTNRAGAAFIVGLWIATTLLLLWLFWPGPAVAPEAFGHGGFPMRGSGQREAFG